MWGFIHRGEMLGFFYWYSQRHHEVNSNVNASQMEASQSLMSDSVWMLKYLQMSFAHGADLPWAVFKPSGLLLNVIVRHRNCTQMIRSEGHSVPLFMCSWIQEMSEKVYYNTHIKVQKSFFFPFLRDVTTAEKIWESSLRPSDELKLTIEGHQAFFQSSLKRSDMKGSQEKSSC